MPARRPVSASAGGREIQDKPIHWQIMTSPAHRQAITEITHSDWKCSGASSSFGWLSFSMSSVLFLGGANVSAPWHGRSNLELAL